MPIVSIFSGSFSSADEITERLQKKSGLPVITDADIVKKASLHSEIPEKRLSRCFSARTSVFNPFTHEFERSLAWLKRALAEYLQENRVIVHGFAGHLIPSAISHALRVCIIKDTAGRIRECARACNLDPGDAKNRIAAEDAEKTRWVKIHTDSDNPWNSRLYDMVLPVGSISEEKALMLLEQGMEDRAAAITEENLKATASFMEETEIEAALAGQGHAVRVKSDENTVTLIIDRPVMMMERLEAELRDAAAPASAGKNIRVRVEPRPGLKEAYRKFDNESPSRILLVDDEQEFVQTLSERLEMRDIGSAIAYDGESALEIVETDEPEVLLLDLQMPGINGIEVLKHVKETRPEIEVVILTGHGTRKDRETCIKLGAFAYLEKPVDIDILSRTLGQANEKMRKNLNQGT